MASLNFHPAVLCLLAGTSRAWGLLRPGVVTVLSRMLDPRKHPFVFHDSPRGRSCCQLMIKGLRTKCSPERAFPESYFYHLLSLPIIPHACHSVPSTLDYTEVHEDMESFTQDPRSKSLGIQLDPSSKLGYGGGTGTSGRPLECPGDCAKGSPGEILAKCTLRTFLFILSSIQCLPGDWRVLKALAMA